MKINLFFILLLFEITACVNGQGLSVQSPEVIAQHFMQDLLHSKPNLEDSVVADIAFLNGHTQNSKEGRLILRHGLQMMGQYLRHTIEEAGIDSQKAIFVSALDTTILPSDKQINITLHIYEPNQGNKEKVDAAQLITRWRRTEEGWKLDMNPYLDNFRYIK